MNNYKRILQTMKPGIPKRYLLFVAGVVWTFAGGMLLFRGFSMLMILHKMIWMRLFESIIAGILFFVFLFSKISFRHIHRIIRLPYQRPCLFSFFNWKSYLMMSLMMSMGILLRTTGIVPMEYLSIFYVAMGIPLFMSAFRFYFNGIFFKKEMKKAYPDE